MPIELLMELFEKKLPILITDPDHVDKLRILSAAGHVIVRLPAGNEEQLKAEVLEITEKGKQAIRTV